MSNNNPWIINGSSGGIGIAAASQNTISLSNISGYNNSISLGDLEFAFNDNVKKYEVYEISQDLLALSVCWARYRKVKDDLKVRPTITKLLDSELFRLVSEDDIVQANNIRDYYSKKIMVWKLKNVGFTSFRKDLNTFVHSDGKTFKEDMIPLAYRLPEFYEYDIEFEKMLFEYNKEVKRQDGLLQPDKKKLKFVKQLTVNKKRFKCKEYWFSDNHNNLVALNFEITNPLISLLDMTINNTDVIIDGIYRKKSRDGYEFLRIDNKFKFV
jgi:hypothetical protein